MNRRRLLSTVAVALGGLLAGCNTGNGDGSSDANGSTTATGAPPTTGESATTPGSATTSGSTMRAAGTTPETTDGTRTVASTTSAEPRTTTERGKAGGPQTVTARVPATETPAPTATDTARPTTTASTPTEPTTGTSNTSDIPTPIPVPDPPGTRTGTGTAQVTFENGGSRVVVTGVITGEDGCQEPVLASAQPNPNGGDLVVTVGTQRSAGTDTMCSQALTPVKYRFVLTPDIPPASVTVVHAGPNGRRTVTTAERGD